MKFVDEATIFVQAGDGGNGCVSFRREKFVPRGGPDGGDGGDGGSVYLIGRKGLQTLYDLQLKPHYKAKRGMHGKGKGMDGKSGDDCYIPVPLGVEVYKNDSLIGEILKDGEKLLVAKGGKGGRGNRHFATSINQVPRFAEKGMPGERWKLKIILKLLAEVGIVGFPNAGKSTLLNAITNARSKVGDYPFTTLNPNLGVLKDEFKSIVIADMPGVIEGAHRGRGLGLKFLRHIERTKLLILMIDISVPEPLKQYQTLLEEFVHYNPLLLKKPRIVVFNKIDLIKKDLKFNLKEPVFYISALKSIGIEELVNGLKKIEYAG
uniref:GTPase Obg n=1 Tax=candidate division WOR-3 bacterium TaxID=2052148 RepID=A0A7C4TGR8_UNCW3